MAAKHEVGRYGERVAFRHLTEAGWVVLDRNWRSPDPAVPGELDLVAMDNRTLVVVEVRTRRSCFRGGPIESVDADKLRRLRRLTGVWLSTRRHDETAAGRVPADAGLRIDVIGVVLRPAGAPVVTHVRGVS